MFGDAPTGALEPILSQAAPKKLDEPILGFVNVGQVIGQVRNPADVLWSYRPPRSGWNFINGIARFPGFEFVDPDGRILFQIRRTRSFPRSHFVMTRDGDAVATIKNLSLLSTDYEVKFTTGTSWRISIPAFAARLRATSNQGDEVSLHMRSELIWFSESCPALEIVAAIAFVHSERIRTK